MRGIGKLFSHGIWSLALRVAAGSCLAAAAYGGIPISPYLVGENLWYGDTPGKDANQAWGRMKEGGFRMIRVGGYEHNQKTPALERYINWVDSIRSIGAEPLLQVSSIDPASVAADVVMQLNMRLKYGIKFWAIGNEPTCGRAVDVTTLPAIAANIKERATAMKKVDPSIKTLVGDECFWRPALYDALIGGAADITGKDAAGNWYVDVVSFHDYPFPGSNKNSVFTRQQVLESGLGAVRYMFNACSADISLANSKHARTGSAALACALTEFNITYWNSSDNTPSGVGVRSFLNGQVFAEVFGMAMKSGALTVTPWSIMEANGDGSGADLGLFDGPDPLVPRPSYYHSKMVAQNLKGEYIASTVAPADKGLLKTLASRNLDESSVLILNENETQGFRFNLKLSSTAPAPTDKTLIRVDAGWDGSYSDTIPPQSTLLLKFRNPMLLLSRQFYSVEMARKYLPPKVEPDPVTSLDGRVSVPVAGNAIVNAGSGRISGDLRTDADYEITLASLDGRIVAGAKGHGRHWELALTAERNRLYALRIRAGAESETRRILFP